MSADYDIAGRASFDAADWRVFPDRCEIERNGAVVRLEPLSMRLLCLLVDNPGRTFTRDDLVERLWSGRAVTDDAITRQIGKLRAALGDDARSPKYLKTMPKVGVRWIGAEPPAPPPQPVLGSRRLLAAGLVILVLAATGLALVLRRPGPEALSVRPLVALAGYEIEPDLSASNDWLAYAARGPGQTRYGLFIRSLSGGDSRRIEVGEVSARQPAWSPTADRIAFVAIAEGACTVRTVSPLGGQPRVVGPCRDAQEGGLAWLDADTLVISDREAPDRPFALMALDVRTGERRALTSPPAGFDGDTDPVVADGRLIFTRGPTLGVEDIHERLPNGDLRRLTFDNTKIHGLSPEAGGRSLLVSSNRLTGVFALWRLDTRSGEWTQLTAAGSGDSPAASRAGRRFVFERWQERVALWTGGADRAHDSRLSSVSAFEWAPALSPDGRRMAYISDREGSAEVWVASADGANARRLTDLGGPYVQEPAWSPDGQTIAAAAPRKGQYDILLIHLPTGVKRWVGVRGRDERHPAFMPDGRLIFARRDGPNWNIHDHDLATGAETMLVRGGMRALPDGRAGLLFTRPYQPGLWRLDRNTGAVAKLADGPSVVDARNWDLEGRRVWMFVREPAPDRPHLATLDLDTGRLSVTRELVAAHHKSGLAVRGGRVWIARLERSEADLMIAEPVRERR